MANNNNNNNNNNNKITQFVDVLFSNISSATQRKIRKIYKKSPQVFSSASPYGQILQALEAIYQSSILYLKNTLGHFDVWNTSNVNKRMVRGLARIAGHNPGRGISATGTLKLQLRSGIDALNEIGGGEMTVINNTRIRNKTNNLEYYINLGTDVLNYKLEPGRVYSFPIVQGIRETQIFTGNGLQNQSFAVNVNNQDEIEDFRITVSVNGTVWTKKEHLFDMLENEEAYYIRTGFENGIEIYFGTGNFGQIPPLGSEIRVDYVLTQGSDGNILQMIENDWTFIDDVFDGFGETINMEEFFLTFIENEIDFGGDGESLDFTRNITPYVSRNFVLALPEQFIFHLKRLNVFSQVDAYTTEKGSKLENKEPVNDGVIFLFLVPDFRLQLNNNNDYFTVSEDAFFLDEREKNKTIAYLNTQGIVSLGTSIKIENPAIKRYVMYIYLYHFDDMDFTTVRQNILSAIADYFVNLERRDRIPKSDLIRVIENVDGVDSLDIEFISQANEEYHRSFDQHKEQVLSSSPTTNPENITLDGYDPNRTIGLDPQLGDIVFGKNELVIIRGGWSTRYGEFHKEDPQIQGLGSVNFIVQGTTRRSNLKSKN